MKELLDYGFVEGVEFEGLMPLAAEKIGVVGSSDVVVKHLGFEAKGVDALEVADVTALFAEEATEDVTVEE